MSGGYRQIIVVLGGSLILASPSYSNQGNSNQRKPHTDVQRQLERIATIIEKQPVAPTPDRGCQPGHDNRQSDLCAQWKAADAAAESANWAFWTLIASIIGLALGAGTLFAAWRAAHWAKRAAAETQRTADAADKSLEHSRSVTMAELRPYLAFTTASVALEGGNVTIQIKYRNFGSVPARNIEARCGADISGPRVDLPCLHDATGPDFIAPGQEITIGFNFLHERLDNDMMLAEIERGSFLWVFSEICFHFSAIDNNNTKECIRQVFVANSVDINSLRLRSPTGDELLWGNS